MKQGTEYPEVYSIISFKDVWTSSYLIFYKCGFHVSLRRESGLHEQIYFLFVNLKSNVRIMSKDTGHMSVHNTMGYAVPHISNS